jgi:hypothetical protein
MRNVQHREYQIMVARARFAGTHLENAPQWLREIEELTMGGWQPTQLSKVQIVDNVARHQDEGSSKKGVSMARGVPRHVRISEPRMAPRPALSVRHHHFEQKVILASRKGAVSVAQRRAAYGEGFDAADGIISAEVRATNEAAYAEGSKSTEAERVVYVTATNGASFEERMRFWNAANENAHFVGDHRISVTTVGVEASWDKVAQDPTMPDVLRDALAKAKASPDGSATHIVNDAGLAKRWLKKRKRSFPPELRECLKLETPHNSRVAYSIVSQFPHNMSAAGRETCLDQLVAEFTKRRTPCQAVIHEPTKKNTKKNWHAHLIYYAGEAEQLLDGRWSFEREQCRDQWGTMKSVPLKRLPRNDDITSDEWVPFIKARWAAIINEQAQREGIDTRFTNETNKARGLPAAQTRYSPGRQALHKQGFFTDDEIAANIRSWREWKERHKKRVRRMMAQTRARLTELRSGSPHEGQDCTAQPNATSSGARAKAMLAEMDALTEIAGQAAMLRHMIESGAKDTLVNYRAIDEAAAEKAPTPSRIKKRDFAQAICSEAEAHLERVSPITTRLAEIQEAAFAAVIENQKRADIWLASPERDVPSIQAAGTAEVKPLPHERKSEPLTDKVKHELAARLALGRGL